MYEIGLTGLYTLLFASVGAILSGVIIQLIIELYERLFD